ncbi:hypothetical protein PG996_010561 [Apiospora saccharicola]|uniref:Glycoside hydrolase 131 catalytic N-terminal domain-containing protein n=1 Tax=Apiospora saccharicola TaxID=335842 RepID=A0ABR1UNZ0_9PEZI
MYTQSSFLVALASLASLGASQKCKLQFDGRVPTGFAAAKFDADNGIFNPSNVVGKGLKLSEVIKMPAVNGSLFDTKTKPVEVTINDKSIFAPSATNVQTGFRRAELLIASNNGTDGSAQGVKTLHFSVMKDAAKPLNLTHEYQLVFLEDNSFSTNQFVLKTGTILGGDAKADPDTLQLFGNVNSKPLQTLFSTKFTEGVFHNFAVTNDFNKKTTQVFYSTGVAALKEQTKALANDNSGQGQFHFGILKKGLGGGSDITKEGIQEANIDEGVIFGGIFNEDSSTGCVSLTA